MYDFLFITSIPSFYKINLYNALAKQCRIYVIFLSHASTIRSADFFDAKISFPYKVLDKQTYEQRHWFSNSLKLIKLMRAIEYQKVIVGGWDTPEYWLTVLIHPKKYNAVVVESSISDSTSTGIKGLIKKFFISRLSIAFVSGHKHRSLLNTLNFQGNIVITGGVGLINQHSQAKITDQFQGQFLYVGRLSVEKNLNFLITVFKQFPQFQLTLLGIGPLKNELKHLASDNIHFIEHCPNNEIDSIYLQHDVLLLVSQKEPWGLVIEEALYYGLPVIASAQVGCVTDLISHYESGLIIDGEQKNELAHALKTLSDPNTYQKFQHKVALIDFKQRADAQIQSYLKVITNHV
jgi:glycosyltransferase involved in cell wall biosynthesis